MTIFTKDKAATALSASDRARLAVGEFNKLAINLTGVASAMTGRKIPVVAGSGTYTDGKKIYIKPDIRLADRKSHSRKLCDLRDPITFEQQCEACAVRDEVMVRVYHEVGHIAYDSFATVKDADARGELLKTVKERADAGDKRSKRVMDRFDKGEVLNWIDVARATSPYLEFLQNALEDVRINTRTMDERPGTVPMFHASTYFTMENGVMDSGKTIKWSEAKPNQQAIIAVMLYAEGMDPREHDGWFSEEVLDLFNDEELCDLLDKVSHTESARETYRYSLPVLDKLREHGFCLDADDTEDGNDKGDKCEVPDCPCQDEPEGGESGVIVVIHGGNPSGDPQPIDPDELEGIKEVVHIYLDHGDDPLERSKPSRKDAEAEDQIEKVMEQEWFKGESSYVSTLLVHKFQQPHPDPKAAVNSDEMMSRWRNAGRTPPVTEESVLAPLVSHARTTFIENEKSRMERNRTSGRINARALGRRVPIGDERIFKKKSIPGKRNYFVVLGLDVSCSTANGAIDEIKLAAAYQAEMLSRLGVPFAIYAHTSMGGYGDSYGTAVSILEVKAPADPWDDDARMRLAQLVPIGGNLDGRTLEFYHRIASEQRATDKVIMYFTDGSMPVENYDEELLILQREIKECKQEGIHLIGVGVRTDSPRHHGLDTVQVDSPDDAKKVVKHLEKVITS